MNNIEQEGDTKSRYLYFSIFIFIGVLLTREFVVPYMSGYVVVGIMALLMIMLPYKHCISFLCFILPLTCGIPGYSMLVSYFIIMLKSKHINRWQIIPPICLIVLELMHVVGYDFEISLGAVFSYSSFLLVFFYLLFNQDSRILTTTCIKLFIFGAIFASVVVVLQLSKLYGFEELMLGSLRGGIRSNAENQLIGQFDLNANSMAFYSIATLSCLFIGRKILNMSNVVHTLLIILAIGVGIISFSRTWVLVALLMSIMFFTNSRKKLWLAIICLISICVLIYIFPTLFNSFMEVFTGRFELDNMETGGGRSNILRIYHNAFINNPRFYIGGTGVVHYTDVINYPLAMHSGFQQLYVCCGLVGLIIFTASAWHYKRYFITKGLPFTYYMPLLASFIFNQTIQFLNPYFLMLPFILVAYILQLKVDHENI